MSEGSLLLEVLPANVQDVAIDRVQVVFLDDLNLDFLALLVDFLPHALVCDQCVGLRPSRLGQTENGLVVWPLLLSHFVVHLSERHVLVKLVVLLFVSLLCALGLAQHHGGRGQNFLAEMLDRILIEVDVHVDAVFRI